MFTRGCVREGGRETQCLQAQVWVHLRENASTPSPEPPNRGFLLDPDRVQVGSMLKSSCDYAKSLDAIFGAGRSASPSGEDDTTLLLVPPTRSQCSQWTCEPPDGSVLPSLVDLCLLLRGGSLTGTTQALCSPPYAPRARPGPQTGSQIFINLEGGDGEQALGAETWGPAHTDDMWFG